MQRHPDEQLPPPDAPDLQVRRALALCSTSHEIVAYATAVVHTARVTLRQTDTLLHGRPRRGERDPALVPGRSREPDG